MCLMPYYINFGKILVLVVLVGILIAISVGEWDWGELEDNGWIHHDNIKTVYSLGWINGEYKHCTNINAKNDEPYVLCDDAKIEERGKVFKVRFYGRTHKPELPFETTFDWRCRKNGDEDPVITCRSTSKKY